MSHETVKLACEVAARKSEFDAAIERFRASLVRGLGRQADMRRAHAHELLDSWLDADTQGHTQMLIDLHRRSGGVAE